MPHDASDAINNITSVEAALNNLGDGLVSNLLQFGTVSADVERCREKLGHILAAIANGGRIAWLQRALSLEREGLLAAQESLVHVWVTIKLHLHFLDLCELRLGAESGDSLRRRCIEIIGGAVEEIVAADAALVDLGEAVFVLVNIEYSYPPAMPWEESKERSVEGIEPV